MVPGEAESLDGISGSRKCPHHGQSCEPRAPGEMHTAWPVPSPGRGDGMMQSNQERKLVHPVEAIPKRG
eukprot:2165107-Prorocentrum_lima.AAC.1